MSGLLVFYLPLHPWESAQNSFWRLTSVILLLQALPCSGAQKAAGRKGNPQQKHLRCMLTGKRSEAGTEYYCSGLKLEVELLVLGKSLARSLAISAGWEPWTMVEAWVLRTGLSKDCSCISVLGQFQPWGWWTEERQSCLNLPFSGGADSDWYPDPAFFEHPNLGPQLIFQCGFGVELYCFLRAGRAQVIDITLSRRMELFGSVSQSVLAEEPAGVHTASKVSGCVLQHSAVEVLELFILLSLCGLIRDYPY